MVRLLETFTALVKPAARTPRGPTSYLRHLGVAGLFFLAIADGTPLPTFAGPDILIAILAARQREPWYYYAAVAALGSVIGAYLTFRMARKLGLEYLNGKFGDRKFARLLVYFQRWGTGALVFSSLVPFPFPTSTFFAAAGVLNYPARTFVFVVALSRAARYAAIAAIAAHYGRRFVVGLLHPGQHPAWLFGLAALAVLTILAARMLARQLE